MSRGPRLAAWGLLACLLAAGAAAQVTCDPPSWEPDPPPAVGQDVATTLAVINHGSVPLEVFKVSAGAGWSASLAQRTLPPGRPVDLRVALVPQPTDQAGQVRRGEVTIDFAQPTVQPALVVPLRAELVPAAQASPLPLAMRRGRWSGQPAGGRPLEIAIFFNSGCAVCVRLLEEVVAPLQRYFGPAVRWTVSDALQPADFARLQAYRRAYGLSQVANTYAFVGNQALAGSAIDYALPNLLLAELVQPSVPPARLALELAGASAEGGRDAQLPSGWGAAALLAIGLLDGLNPCAFATAVLLVALLTQLGGQRRTLLAAGLAYAGAVFVTYTLLGLGLLAALDPLGRRAVAANLLRWAVAGLALVAAGVQVSDVLALRRGAPTRDLTGQLPGRLKRWLHGLLHALLRPQAEPWQWVVGAAAAGAGVTLIELVCTSQVYLPVLVALRSPERRSAALPLLLVYNVGFVLPLLVVLGAAWRGLGSPRLAAWAAARLPACKLALALLLVGLAAWLLAPDWLG